MLIGDSVICDGRAYTVVGFTPTSVEPAQAQLLDPDTGSTLWADLQSLSTGDDRWNGQHFVSLGAICLTGNKGWPSPGKARRRLRRRRSAETGATPLDVRSTGTRSCLPKDQVPSNRSAGLGLPRHLVFRGGNRTMVVCEART